LKKHPTAVIPADQMASVVKDHPLGNRYHHHQQEAGTAAVQEGAGDNNKLDEDASEQVEVHKPYFPKHRPEEEEQTHGHAHGHGNGHGNGHGHGHSNQHGGQAHAHGHRGSKAHHAAAADSLVD
jgi:hypothetical protein